jgi:nitroimidazol reductase NimA-like FMN-containing flavoprotein (pyridoxamine 5'-phosphate oxidase superfamily)
MEQVRYKERNCTDQKKIEAFLQETRTGVIGMQGDRAPYAVPVNYVWYNGAVYFHGMGSGKKEDILSKEPLVCFTVYKEQGTVTDAVPCHADTAYMSVMFFGKAEKVTDAKEGAAALQILLDKYMPQYYSQTITSHLISKYRSSIDGNAVSVYRITPQEMTAKENAVSFDKLFSHGKHGS